jgi:GNAT superfamily N-acetyltransferase
MLGTVTAVSPHRPRYYHRVVLELREVPADQLSDWSERLSARRTALRFALEYDDRAVAAERAAEAVDRVLPESTVYTVEEDDVVVGFVWWGSEGPEAVPYDLQLDDPARVDELLPLLLERARADGRALFGVSARPDDPTGLAMIALPGFTARATNMRLVLDGPVADPAPVELHVMTEEEFDTFRDLMVVDYAGELAQAGMTQEAAQKQSEVQTAQLIPDGLASEGQSFFTARVEGEPVGRLWLSTERPMSFVYDIEVRAEHRRKGYGAAIMNAGAIWSREHGHFAIGLNVFAHNPGARALYDRLGYQVTLDFRTVPVGDGA